MTYQYKIADKIIEINSIYPDVHEYCKDYRVVGMSDFSVTILKEDIEFEKTKSLREAEVEGVSPYHYPDGYLEELAVYRKIASEMIDYNTILFHGSVVSVDDKAYLFTAKSGTGKSTHTRLWRKYFGERAIMVNDDKPLLKVDEKGVFAYGTPYNGKHRISNNICVPLKAIVILNRAETNTIVTSDKSEVFPMLLQQTYRPDDKIKMIKTLKILDRLSDNVRLYKLYCNMDIEAAKIAYEGMK